MPKFTVGIVGAGLGGLVLALALERFAPDVEVHIYEGASKLTELGAGIAMHKRISDIMRVLGLEESLMEIRGDEEARELSVTYHKGDQQDGPLFHQSPPDTIRTYHRGETQAVFVKHLKTSVIHISKRVVKYVEHEDKAKPLELHFQDGGVVTCDAVIGSDGIRSAVRRTMYTHLAEQAGDPDEAARLGTHISPVWTGELTYRTLIPRDVLMAQSASGAHPGFRNPTLYCGKNRSCITYAVSGGSQMFVGYNVINEVKEPDSMYDGPWVTTSDKGEVDGEYSGWTQDVRDVIECTAELNRWAVHMVKPLPTYTHGRVTLLGDAAHAMIQFQGAGAGQAFEDGFLLAHLLAHPKVTRDTLATALRVYDEVRRPFSQAVAAASMRTARLVNMDAGPARGVTAEQSKTGRALGVAQLSEIGREIEATLEWSKTTSITEDWDGAIALLERSLV